MLFRFNSFLSTFPLKLHVELMLRLQYHYNSSWQQCNVVKIDRQRYPFLFMFTFVNSFLILHTMLKKYFKWWHSLMGSVHYLMDASENIRDKIKHCSSLLNRFRDSSIFSFIYSNVRAVLRSQINFVSGTCEVFRENRHIRVGMELGLLHVHLNLGMMNVSLSVLYNTNKTVLWFFHKYTVLAIL